MRIIQFLAGFSRGDAISRIALNMRACFRSWGHASEIVCEASRILADLRDDAWTLDRYLQEASPADLVLLHLSIGSPVNAAFAQVPGRKALLYHNITPPQFFEGLDQTRPLEEGRRQAAALANVAEVNLAVSRFNADDLRSMGYRDVAAFPPLLDLDPGRVRPDRAKMAEYGDGLVNIVFVGRCVPNKRIEDLLSVFYYFQNYVEPRSRFIHIGSHAGTEQYHAVLLAYAHDLALEHADMIGSVSDEDLGAVYATAGVFLCMSEHEGFCIPLLESMAHDVPVVAFAGGAVPETLDGAGILVHEKRYDLLAELLGRLTREQTLRESVIQGQRQRIERYRQRDAAAELRRHLAPLM